MAETAQVEFDRAEQRRMVAERLHLIEAILLAINRREELVLIVAGAGSADAARAQLQAQWRLDAVQATAILDLQLRRIATLERTRIADEVTQLRAELADLV